MALVLVTVVSAPLACAYDYDAAFGDQDGVASSASASGSSSSAGGGGGSSPAGGGGSGGEPPSCPGAEAGDPLPWVRSFGSGADGERVTALAVDEQGGIVLGGAVAGIHDDWLFADSAGGADADAFLAHLSRDGAVLWAIRFAGVDGSADLLHDLALGPDSIVATFTSAGGLSHATDSIPAGAALATFALANGKLLWARPLGAATEHDPSAVAVLPGNAQTAGIVVGGRFEGTLDLGDGLKEVSLANGYDGYVAAFDTQGLARAVKWVQSPGSDRIIDVATDETGRVYATGALGEAATVCSAHNGVDDQETVLVMRLDDDLGCGAGWSKVFGGENVQVGNGLAIGTGELYVAGSFRGTVAGLPPTGGATDGFVMRLNPNTGATSWVTAFGGSAVGDFDTATSLAISANGIVAAGFFSSGGKLYDDSGDLAPLLGNGGLDMFVSHLDKSGKPQALEAWGDEQDQWQDGANTIRVASVPRGIVAGGSLRGSALIGRETLVSVGGADAWIGRLCTPSTPLP
ncbi:MAG: hypothetical protein WKG00_01915 [Polyangiaceae bacterium]